MKSVAVIGAGPAGLVTIKELKQAGLDVTAFEYLDIPGGRWAKSNTGIWKELCLNLTRRWMEFSDFPWSDKIGSTSNKQKDYAGLFAHNEEFREYLDAYAKNFDLLPLIQFNTKVISANANDNGWTVVTQSTKGGEEMTQQFDGLVVCTGIYNKKFHPLAETTLKGYTGDLIHAEQFQSAKEYKGKSVLVVGSVISGPEISAVLATDGDCQKVCNSTRHVTYHMTKLTPKDQKPYDDLMFIRFPAWLGRILPESMMLPGLKSLVTDNFTQLTKGENCYSDPDPDISVAGIGTTKNYVELVQQGRLQVVPGIQSASGKVITFTDGSSQDFDTIICGTGYGPDVSFLSEDLRDKLLYKAANGKHELVLYRDCLAPEIPNLAFCGIMTIVGPLTAAQEMQARLIAGSFSGKWTRPSESKLKRVASEGRKAREASPFKQYKNCVVLMEEIGDDLGVTPSLLKAFRSPSKYLFAPCYPVQYRTNAAIDGEEMAAAAQERFEYYLANPQTAKI